MLRKLIASVLKIVATGLIVSICLTSASLTTYEEFTTERFHEIFADQKGKPPPVPNPIKLAQVRPAFWRSSDGLSRFNAQYAGTQVSMQEITKKEPENLVAIHNEEENETMLISLGKTSALVLNTPWEQTQKLDAYVLNATPPIGWEVALRQAIIFDATGIKYIKKKHPEPN